MFCSAPLINAHSSPMVGRAGVKYQNSLCNYRLTPAVRLNGRNKISIKQLPPASAGLAALPRRDVTAPSAICCVSMSHVSSQAEISTGDMCVMEEHHRGPGLCLSKPTRFNLCDKSKMGTSKRPRIFNALSKAGCPQPVMIWRWPSSHCASHAHVWISSLNFQSLLGLLALVSQSLRTRTLPSVSS